MTILDAAIRAAHDSGGPADVSAAQAGLHGAVGRVVGVDKEELRSSIMQEHRDKAAAGAGLEKVNPEQDIDEPLSLFSSPYAFLRARLRSFFN